MRVFHICNNYVSSLVHEQLITRLANPIFQLKQFVYVPVRKVFLEKNDNANYKIKYDYVISPGVIKYFPLLKVLKVFWLGYKKYRTDLNKSNVLFGHTLWSDGMVCLLLSKILKKDYVICVRNTDLNVFLRYLFHYRMLHKLIVKNARYIIFISYANYYQAMRKYPTIFNIPDKIKIIPNGVDEYWLENINYGKLDVCSEGQKIFKLIYVGRLDGNKNLDGTYKACCQLLQENRDLHWTIIGGERTELINLLNIKYLPEWISHYPTTNDKGFIKEKYRENDIFIMPSFRETFGLVYVEAITQGCVCICSTGQGIDGFFERFNIIETCIPTDTCSIKNAIVNVQKKRNYPGSGKLNSYIIDNFSWDSISKKYYEILRGRF
ncbi:glycosyltransferase family 4 protein [Citrobacter koseri]|uniref:glycosyltransferase family 4 protein n=1 Tax=Citrobacter koseri TaxID=545 RepID=UPI001A1FB8EE|nr:glycosyltransferase [Citrobacter koseri]HDQ2586406.1 glycosyltransferase [Citrobacter koseri]